MKFSKSILYDKERFHTGAFPKEDIMTRDYEIFQGFLERFTRPKSMKMLPIE